MIRLIAAGFVALLTIYVWTVIAMVILNILYYGWPLIALVVIWALCSTVRSRREAPPELWPSRADPARKRGGRR